MAHTSLPHTATPNPIKHAIKIDTLTRMADGQEIGSDQFELRLILGTHNPTQEQIIKGKSEFLKFVGYRESLKHIHDVIGEETYYQSLGIEKPYRNFTNFKIYVETAINYNEVTKAMKPYFNEKFKGICRENGIVPFKLF